MTLRSGVLLGPYEITGALGAGGMGEVYRARDTRLDRTVAIKVLSADLAPSDEVKARFAREARAISALNHPHICTLHDVGCHDGTDFLVMEYLEGETLATRLARGALPVQQALTYAQQIADALDRAHRHGVVHRDLKPANIILTKAGIKLLDFGLAKLRSNPAPGAVGADVATASVTAQGTILGTLQYMAPEQLEGKDADARTDVFAFGVVLYEMLTGQHPFSGSSSANVIAGILRAPAPALTIDASMASPALDHVIRTCLAKDPDERWQSAADIGKQLAWMGREVGDLGRPDGGDGRVHRESRSALAERLAWAATALVLGALAVWLSMRGPTTAAVIRSHILPPEGAAFYQAMVSPDGRRLAFSAVGADGRELLWLQDLDTGLARPLPHAQSALNLSWSPDSRSVAFTTEGSLKRIELDGSGVQELGQVRSILLGAAWSREGVVLYSPSFNNVLYKVATSGGQGAPVTTLDHSRLERAHRFPQFLPDGRRFIFLAQAADPQQSAIYLGALDHPRVTRLVGTETRAVYVPGYLLFARDGALMAQPFDDRSERMTGEPRMIADRVVIDSNSGWAAFSASETGVLVYQQAEPFPTELVWFTRTGKRLRAMGPPARYISPAVSPDGTRVALELPDERTGTHNIWILDAITGRASRLTFGRDGAHWPKWSPDGTRIVYASGRKGPWDLYVRSVSESASETLVLQSNSTKRATQWSSDGRFIVYDEDAPGGTGLGVLPLTGDRVARPFTTGPHVEAQGQLSPDSRWMAYASNESGRFEVYVQPYPPSGAKWQVSTSGGGQPRWRPDGRELVYLTYDRTLMAVEVRDKPHFQTGPPQRLFPVRLEISRSSLFTGPFDHDMGPDGQLMVTTLDQTSRPPLNLVVNWTQLMH